MKKQTEQIIKITVLALSVTGIMHVLFQKSARKRASLLTGEVDRPIANPQKVEDEFEKFIKKKKNEGLPYEKAVILEQIARIESRHFKSELLYRTNNVGAITSQSPKNDTVTIYVKPLYKNGVFQGNIITDEKDPNGKPYYYKVYPTLQDGLKAFYNVVVANNYDYKRYSGDKNATLKGIKHPIADAVYKI